jgi:hypothetical protein
MSSSLGVEFSLKPGQQTLINGEDLTIKFNSVSNDSRCPSDTECISAGNAEINLELTKTGNPTVQILLNTAGITGLPDQTDYLNYAIRVIDLQPYPKSGSTILQADYSARFIVIKQ